MTTTEKKAAAKPKPVTATVRGKNKSVLFDGLLADAERFIADNFPRIHSEESGPDFTVETDPKGRKVKMPEGYPDADASEDE